MADKTNNADQIRNVGVAYLSLLSLPLGFASHTDRVQRENERAKNVPIVESVDPNSTTALERELQKRAGQQNITARGGL